MTIIVFVNCQKVTEHKLHDNLSIEKIENFEIGNNDLDDEENFFARITSITSSDSIIYLLDSELIKIGKFDYSGSHLSSIKGRIGRGPGEFSLPSSIHVGQDVISVYDYNNSSIASFSNMSNKYIETKLIKNKAKNFISSDSLLFYTIHSSRTHKLGIKSIIEDSVINIIEVSERDLEFSNDGTVSILSKNYDKVLVGAQRPGIWYEVDNNLNYQMKGEDLLYDRKAKSFKEQDFTISPAFTLEIGEIQDEMIAVLWYDMIFGNEPSLNAYHVSVFTKSGEHIRTFELEYEWVQSAEIDKYGNVFVALSTPYSRVEKYSIKVAE